MTEARGYVVKRSDPARIANAVVRYQLVRPQFWAPLALGVLVLVVLGAARFGAAGAVGGAVLLLVIVAGVLLYKRRQLRSVLTARGYRPGASLDAEFGEAQVSIAAQGGTAVHRYDDIADAQRLGDVVVLRLRAARLLVALPGELVPEARLQALRAAP